MKLYRNLKWKACPFCKKTSGLVITPEHLFYQVKEEYGTDAAVEVSCDCGCQLWAYSREGEENGYGVMLKVLNDKWNNRWGKKVWDC